MLHFGPTVFYGANMPRLEDPFTFSLRIPQELADELNKVARAERRSLNTTARILVEEALEARKRRPEVSSEERTLRS